MERPCFPRRRLSRIMAVLQYILGIFVIFVSLASLHRFYSAGVFLPANDSCEKFHTVKDGYADFDIMALSDRVDEVLNQLLNLQDKLEFTVRNMGKSTQPHFPAGKPISSSDLKLFLEEDVIQPLYSAYVALRLIRIPKPEEGADHLVNIREDPLINHFTVEEIRKYITQKGNRGGNLNIYGTNKTFNTIGHACVLMRKELEEYMNYDVGSYCKDDWNLAQTLMLGGCDPLPRRRCLARASKFYQRPLPINESLWQLPDDRNVRWSNYQCRDFKCLSSKNHKRGFSICTGCFEMEKEKMKWVKDTSLVEFLISDVLALKPGEIRIGLDVSTGTGSFAARMREWNVTIISTVLNIGAPFSEIISLRGLVPLYFSMNQRLPFFDNTLDLIHTNVFLAGWIDLLLLDFILFDWDRILRPGGLLWVDKFFCSRKDLDDYVYMFLQFRYRKHKWVVSFKSKDEVYLSALLEKPPRSL